MIFQILEKSKNWKIYVERKNIFIRLGSCVGVSEDYFYAFPFPSSEENSLFLLASGYLLVPGIVLFFMVSGTLLLLIRIPTKTFLKMSESLCSNTDL